MASENQADLSIHSCWLCFRALTRILKTGVQDSHLAKSGTPIWQKVGVPLEKSGSPTPNKKCHKHVTNALKGIGLAQDTFEES